MKNKTLSNWWVATLVTVLVAGITESTNPVFADTAYIIGGLGMIIFGIISAVRFAKLKD